MALRPRSTLQHQMERWWSNKYNLPVSDIRFQNCTLGEVYLEMLEDLVRHRESLRELLEISGLNHDKTMEQINEINKIFGEEADEAIDPLVEKWERELMEGKIPDLNEQL